MRTMIEGKTSPRSPDAFCRLTSSEIRAFPKIRRLVWKIRALSWARCSPTWCESVVPMDKEVVECFIEEVISTREALDSVVEAVRRPVLRVPYRVTRLWGVTAPALGGQKVIVDSFGLSSSAERWHFSDLKGLNPSKELVQCPVLFVSTHVLIRSFASIHKHCDGVRRNLTRWIRGPSCLSFA